jgi:hypothetical protein
MDKANTPPYNAEIISNRILKAFNKQKQHRKTDIFPSHATLKTDEGVQEKDVSHREKRRTDDRAIKSRT